jgi:hypothetical protein
MRRLLAGATRGRAMTREKAAGDSRWRVVALMTAVIGLAVVAYIEFAMTSAAAQDRFGWFIYEAGAWLLMLFVGPFLPVGRTVLVGALFALGLEGFAYYRVFVVPPAGDTAAIYLWKPLAQLALIAAAWLAGYLTYLRAQRERAHG